LSTIAEELIRRYRWEFLRRNQDFRRDFDALAARLSKGLCEHEWWHDLPANYGDEHLECLRKVIAAIPFGLMKKWDTRKLVPYDWVFDESGRYELRPGVFVEIPVRFWESVRGEVGRIRESELRRESERRINVIDEVVPDEYWDEDIYLRVRITFPIETLISKIEAEIRKARREYKQTYGFLQRKEVHPRRRFDQFEMYLKVWDLKQQGLSLPKIAKRLYPGMHALDRVTDHYRRAKELIGGRYRELE
jgi:hypothetical protein